MDTSHYSALVKIGSQLDGVNLLDSVDTDCLDEAIELLDRIKPILDSIESIELHKCVVPVKCDLNFFNYHFVEIQNLRSLYRAFQFASAVAACNQQYEDVARYASVILDLANAVRRGGLKVDHLVAIAIAGSGVESLRTVRDQFTDEIRRDLIEALVRYESQRESFIEIDRRDTKREAEWGSDNSTNGSNWVEDLKVDPENELPVEAQKALLQLVKALADQPEIEKQALYANMEKRALAMPRLLTVDLAIRCWKDCNRQYPDALADLSPNTLFAVPNDPFTDREFIYRPSGNSFSLYSTGPDKTDGGGTFGPWLACSEGGYDLGLDSEDYGPKCYTIQHPPSFVSRLWSFVTKSPFALRRWRGLGQILYRK